jgi:MFS family permease
MGAYADRVGRREALTLTLLLMAVGSGIVAFTPTYATIGIAAPILSSSRADPGVLVRRRGRTGARPISWNAHRSRSAPRLNGLAGLTASNSRSSWAAWSA